MAEDNKKENENNTMIDNDYLQLPQTCNSPLDLGKQTINDVLKNFNTKLSQISFLSSINIPFVDNEFIRPIQDKILEEKNNKIYLLQIKKNIITILLKANFNVTDVKECIKFYNDKSNKLSTKFYIITIKNAECKIEKNVIISGVMKSDLKQFQAELSNRYNNFCIDMKEN